MKLTNKSITAIAAIVVGLMFLVMKGEVISLAMTALGIAIVVMGILDLVKNKSKGGLAKIIAGALVIAFGWLFVNIALYVIAALMIVYCLGNLLTTLKTDGYPMSTVQTLRTYAKPVIGLVAGVCLFFNQGGTVSWVFVLTGIIFVVEGILMLSESRR